MQPTSYPHVNQFLDELLPAMQSILGQKLVGLYLFGSLVMGDFNRETSDIDLLAAMTSDITEVDFVALKTIHNDLIAKHPEWDNRLEIAYVSVLALKTFRTRNCPIGIISPGEPFHIIDAGIDWLINWYMVREKGIALYGPPPQTIIEPISKAEFLQSVKDHMVGWREWVNDVHHRGAQAYAILTMCRGLYTCTNGEQVSKNQAAAWAMGELPEWASLIQNALVWRQEWRAPNIDHESTLPETQRFVNVVIDRIVEES